MKKLIVVFLILLPTWAIAQNELGKKIDEKYIKEASIAATSWHNMLSLFIDEDYNNINNLSLFLQRYLNFSLTSKITTPINNRATWLFKPKAGTTKEYIALKIATAETTDGWITKKLLITGTPEAIASLFINYWPTKMKQGQNHYIQKIGPEDIIYTVKNGLAYITIKKR